MGHFLGHSFRIHGQLSPNGIPALLRGYTTYYTDLTVPGSALPVDDAYMRWWRLLVRFLARTPLSVNGILAVGGELNRVENNVEIAFM